VSAREAAIAALHAAVAAALALRSPAPLVLRNETIPQRVPAAGLVVLHDGETIDETALLSPLAWEVEQRVDIDVTAPGATAAMRAALLDVLLVDIAATIAADRTLGGAVEWAAPGSPSFDDVDFEGAASVRAASIPVTLRFTAAETPLS
jgi:hypothetical protein